MLVLSIILLLLGAFVVYFGRPREQVIVWAGGLIFIVGVVLLVIWALDRGNVDTNTAMVLLT